MPLQPSEEISRISKKLQHPPHQLTIEEQCALALYQLEVLTDWANAYQDRVELYMQAHGGSGTAPPKPTWPPA